MNQIEIKIEPIALYQLLKLENLAASGGEAKMFISEGLVKLNGVVETRKAKKISFGDIVEFDTKEYKVVTK